MRSIHAAMAVALLATLCGCGGASKKAVVDLSTPEKAILSLEECYRCRDLEGAVRCKDFTAEAELMLKKLNQDFSKDAEMVKETANVLELGFKAEMKEKGFPNFHGITSTFGEKKPIDGRDDFVEIVETCQTPSGKASTNRLACMKRGDEWKVAMIVE